MNPILIDLPEQILTPRVLLRHPRQGDGKQLYEAIIGSLDHLRPWMSWASSEHSAANSEDLVRRAHAKWILREGLMMLIFDRASGELLGGTGLHRINWEVPSFEIGYWIKKSREGQGLISETVIALTRFCFEGLKAKRVEIRIEPANARSLAVPRRLGFNEEGVLRNSDRDTSGDLRDTVVFSRLSADGLLEMEVSWQLS